MADFRLSRVARLRSRLRELREAEMKHLGAQLRRLESERDTTRTTRDDYLYDESVRARQAPLDEQTFRLGRLWEGSLAQREEELGVKIETTEQAIRDKRVELVAARQEEEKLLRLKERYESRVAEDARRREDVVLDELAMQAHNRND